MKSTFLLSIFSICLPQIAFASSSYLQIASWNLKHLGRKKTNIEAIAQQLKTVDLVTFQEVNTNNHGKTALWQIRDLLKLHHKAKICTALSEIPSEANLRYAYLWLNSKVSYVKTNGEIMNDCPDSALTIRLGVKNHKKIRREPAMGTFLVKGTEIKFILASVHLRPTKSKPELEVPPLFDSFQDILQPVIIAGDFNLDSNHLSFQSAHTAKFKAAFRNSPTSLKRESKELSKPYDNFWYRNAELTDQKVVNLYEVLPKMSQKDIYYNVSDHSPIFATIKFQQKNQNLIKMTNSLKTDP